MMTNNALAMPFPQPQMEPYSHVSPEFRQRIPGIFAGESGGDYDALFGFSNREGGPFSNVRLTDMTVNQALDFSNPRGEYGQWVAARNNGTVATPMGAYQVVGSTLRAARDGLGLTGNEPMTPELQDRIGQWIYENQGIGAWVGYRSGVTEMPSGGGGRYAGGPTAPRRGGNEQPMTPQMPNGMMAGNALGPGISPEVLQQAQRQQAVNSLMETINRPIYDFRMQGGNALGGMV